MKQNMKEWVSDTIRNREKKAIPILTFPIIQKMDMNVLELLESSDSQSKGMKMLADSFNAGASVSFMDLSVEAEAFGADVRFVNDEVPTITGQMIDTQEDAEALIVPKVGTARTGIYVEGIQKAARLITDRPVFAGCIGPYSLAGRLVDVSEAMIKCYTDPDVLHTVLKKATEFICQYVDAYKEAGANGIVMAEPLAGILSPALIQEFSSDYVKQIFEHVKSENFCVIYHNCGNNVPELINSILTVGADGYHFGNAIDMKEVLGKLPDSVLGMGNIDPAGEFCNGTPESIRRAVLELMRECAVHDNFVVSSGCDIPPNTPWENVEAFFAAVDEFYGR